MSHPIKIGLISLGCAKNLVDSEVMLGGLTRDGMVIIQDAREADVVIVNTCGFIEASKQESINTILKANELRQTGRCKALIMAGCLTQRYPKDLQKDLPEVDAIVGLNEVPRMAEIVRELLKKSDARLAADTNGQQSTPALFWSGPSKYIPDFAAPRVRLTPRHSAYVKIAEGCNHPCTFCSIPRIRGRHRSRSENDILKEIESLVGQGAREINLISQDTTFYGKDLAERNPGRMKILKNGKVDEQDLRSRSTNLPAFQPSSVPSLPSLLRAVQQLAGDFWVRLLYTHPYHWSDELIETIAACDKVCRYIDMPLQHINDDVLKRMRRETDGRYIRDLVRRIRAGIPGIALRTTFIVGFPGETEEQFDELIDFIKETQFERVGVFSYSQEDHTPAGNMTDQVPPRVRKQRYRHAMTAQQRVSRQVQQRFVGQQIRVLIDRQEGAVHLGRSHADAPEIDGTVRVRGRVQVGEFATIQIDDASEYDLSGAVMWAEPSS